MRENRTLETVTVEYFRQHPDEIDAFVAEIFEDYARDGDSAVLLSALRVVARVRGIQEIAETVGMSRQGVQKALSERGNPRLDTINGILQAIGYQLRPHPIPTMPAL